MANKPDYLSYRTWWKPSRVKTAGYQKVYVAKTPEGDILRADYNFQEDLVRLELKPASEGGKTYVAVVKKGTAIREQEVTQNRNLSLKRKIAAFKHIFSCIPDDSLLQSLSGIYGLAKVSLGRDESDLSLDKSGDYSTKESLPGESFFDRLRRPRRQKAPKEPLWQRVKQRFWGEFHDATVGVGLAFLVYQYFFDYVILGFALGALGFLFGGLDWTLRKRDPLLAKVLIFVVVGSYFFYTGYRSQ
ncbi:MAG: hypothetical protein AAF518_20675 [Spirochaetota bacterium]